MGTGARLELSMLAMHLTGNRPRTHADLNLVPYIDLLTCMIAFLLITAVWTQLARLQVRQHGQGGEPDFEDGPRLTVLVGEAGFYLSDRDERRPLPRVDGGLDFAALARELRREKDRYPDLQELTVAAEDGIPFEALIRTMDTALGAGFPGLAVESAPFAKL